MHDFSKSPPKLVERFGALTTGLPEVERRMTFGYPTLYVGGNMVSGLNKTSWFVRLAVADADELLALEGASTFEPAPGHRMTGFIVMPPAVIADDRAVSDWLARAISYGLSRPPKPPKSRGTTKPKTAAG